MNFISFLFNFLNYQSNRSKISLMKKTNLLFSLVIIGYVIGNLLFFFLFCQTILQSRFETYEAHTVHFKTPVQQMYYFTQKFRSDRQIQPRMTKLGQNDKFSSQLLIWRTVSIPPSMTRVTNSGQSDIFKPKRQNLSRIPKSAQSN